jgi:hypothetical protein
MEYIPTWEADSDSVIQEIPRLLWSLKIHYRLHKSPPLDPTLSHMNPTSPHLPILFA